MAELLIKAISVINQDEIKDKIGCYKRGDIVDIRPDGWPWGKEERLPKFVVIKIPEYNPSNIIDRKNPWSLIIAYQIVSSNLPQDRYTINITATDFNINSGEGKITRSDVESYLLGWNATNISVSDNTVTFTIQIYNAIQSSQFWGLNTTGLVFTEISYTQATGNHRVQINYSGKIWTPQERDQAIEQIRRMGAFVSNDPINKNIVLDIKRSDVQTTFQNDIKQKAAKPIRRRKHCIIESLIHLAEGNGGVYTISQSEIVTYSKNKQTE